jgi:hypothetical protein
MEIKEHPVPSFGKIPEPKKLWFWFFEKFQDQRISNSGFFNKPRESVDFMK